MNPQLDDLDLDDLTHLQNRIAAAISDFDTRAKREARRAAEALARQHGFALAELLSLRKLAPSSLRGVAMFRSPDDPEVTWTGKGRRPEWFKAHVGAGGDPESLRIR